MDTLESGVMNAAALTQTQLNLALAASKQPGAPRDALPITLRGLGYVFASRLELKSAEAAYSKALSEAQRRAPESTAVLGCWHDLAVLSREQGKLDKAEHCWLEALATLQAVQRALSVSERGRGATVEETVAHASARMELELCRADCLRHQEKLEESREVVEKVLAWRETHLGAEHPMTLGAVYDLARIQRAQYLASISISAAPRGAAEPQAAPSEEPAAEAGHSSGATHGVAGSGVQAAAARRAGAPAPGDSNLEDSELRDSNLGEAKPEAKLAAIDSLSTIATDADKRWQEGLRVLCGEESELRAAEHAMVLASVAQLHKEYEEAVFLFRWALEDFSEWERTHPPPSEAEALADADRRETGELQLAHAELLNSLGEALMDLGHYVPAAAALGKAHAKVAVVHGDDDAATASIVANQAKLHSLQGRAELAQRMFVQARETTTRAVASLLPSEQASNQMMTQALHARVLKLYAEHLSARGEEEEGAALMASVKKLDAQFGFITQ